ncbi:Ykof family thiamine-binding protein [Halobacillus shinanisalinarum]|uniref:Ykof family thiamine-binding protein n=1 Tax=Halobacillus shinanisalinarum TaxID=2932258 RepID=A0ABY4H593_9BACI|nr:Ykof family thiamine-binding protein [Halobacillus shinanisalinarum]UOQ95265.1 Ykof family thiamine-binding protein [Halobacillus shinanisalinarum]
MSQACESTNRIAGSSFSIYPMTDRFVEIIKSSLKEVDTSRVWMKADDVTTTVRGQMIHVFDVTRAMFLQAAKTGEHVVFQSTYSIGCPGDSAGDVYMAEDNAPLNRSESKPVDQEVAAKFSLYPMGGGDYMDVIYSQIEEMKKQGVEVSEAHYSTRLDGDGNKVFEGLEQVFQQTEKQGSSHTVMTVTMSANSPSTKGGE